jgi:pimeloyl-ACP methyl ester carboxylesterase
VSEIRIPSNGAELAATLYGKLPARRAVLLCHGANWDASGWSEVAPRFVQRGTPALALNFRGYDGSSGRTTRLSVVDDVGSAVEWLRGQGASEIALVGASMGGYAVLAASARVAPESVVAVSAPVRPISDADAKRISGRKLFVCADHDSLGAAEAVKQAFTDAQEPKAIRFFPGRQHSRAMFKAKYGDEVLQVVVDFVAEGLRAAG